MDAYVASKRVPKPSIIVKYTAFKFHPLFTWYVHVPNSCKKKWVTLTLTKGRDLPDK